MVRGGPKIVCKIKQLTRQSKFLVTRAHPAVLERRDRARDEGGQEDPDRRPRKLSQVRYPDHDHVIPRQI